MKNKLKLLLVALLVVLTSTMVPAMVASAENYLDDADRCFLSYVSENSISNVRYNRTPLYNQLSEQNGWQYNFTEGNKSGYALIAIVKVNDNFIYEVEELKYEETSPFAGCEGLPVYITHHKYLVNREGLIYDLETDALVGETTLEEYVNIGFGYAGSAEHYDSIETISYATKSVTEEYTIPYDLPTYSGIQGSSNCANVAGTIAIGYYDRLKEGLIPDFQTYIQIGPIIKYKTGGTEIDNVMQSLYSLMGTDVNQSGTTFSGFHTGMNSFVNNKGYSYSYTNSFSWGTFDFSKYKTAVQEGKPVTLFLSKYAIVKSSSINNGVETITSDCSDYAHVAMACGYKVETYYDSNGNIIDVRNYLRISVGLQNLVSSIAYLNINGLTVMDHASILTIQ